MVVPGTELEGTWEEIAAHAEALAGQRIRLVVLAPAPAPPAPFRPTSGQSLLRHAGVWEGDDLDERLADAITSRAPITF